MKPSEVLKQYGWTQGHLARNQKGYPVEPDSNSAVCFCAMGALRKVHGLTSHYEFLKGRLRLHINGESVATWNDDPNRTKEEVIAAFEAIGE